MPSEKIEKAFSATCRLLLGAGPWRLERLSGWLLSAIPKWRETSQGGETFLIPYFGAFNSLSEAKSRHYPQGAKIGSMRLRLDKPSAEGLAAEMKNTAKIAVGYAEGTNREVERCTVYKDLSSAFSCLGCYDSKNVAYNSWSDFNDHAFGCHRNFYSSFCIKCYHSSHLQRCFEMDSCSKCSDSYFCHDCENLHDCLFCFNVNNLRYAVANVVVGKEKFERLKKELLGAVARQLREKGSSSLSIYNF